MITITRYRSIYYTFSGLLVGASIVLLLVYGLKFGIDFTGGSLLEGRYEGGEIAKEEIQKAIEKAGAEDVSIQRTEGSIFIARFKDVDAAKYDAMKKELTALGASQTPSRAFTELSFESIGPSVGEELKKNTFYAILLVLLLIGGYVAYAFRKVSHPIRSWNYSAATLLTLFHDIIIPIGVFAFLGHYRGVEVNVPFVAAILTVLGYSVHDTIIVFDRIRENLMKMRGATFENVIDTSLRQTALRSLNTSLTVLLVLVAIYVAGGEGIRYFALTLLIGIGAGTYSSIFVASPLLYTSQQWIAGRKAKKGLT